MASLDFFNTSAAKVRSALVRGCAQVALEPQAQLAGRHPLQSAAFEIGSGLETKISSIFLGGFPTPWTVPFSVGAVFLAWVSAPRRSGF